MKLAWATAVLLLGSQRVNSLSIPFTPQSDLMERDTDSALTDAQFVNLEKRRGGGGGGGRSGGGSGSSSSSGSSSGSSGGSSGGRSGSSSSSSGSTSSSSNRGGSSSGGSGVTPSYGGGRYYAGGARTPYSAGTRSNSGITPFLLPAAALAFFPGVWLWGAYAYPYTHPYYYHDNNSNKNESLPVTCLCEEYQECGCDDINNSTYYESLFNGTQPRNTSNVQVVNVNGTKTIVINGTLPNGTTADDGTSSSTSGAASGPLVTVINASGYWVMVAVVAATVWSF